MNSPAANALFGTPAPPELGPGPRADVAAIREIDAALEELSPVTNRHRDLIRALALLWHDHHEPAHTIVQDIESPDGSYLHAILHRREPDYFNAKYWFRRVGQHPCFEALAARARAILEDRKLESMSKKLIPGGHWDSFAFVNACEANAHPSAPQYDALREIQRAEFELLLDYLLG